MSSHMQCICPQARFTPSSCWNWRQTCLVQQLKDCQAIYLWSMCITYQIVQMWLSPLTDSVIPYWLLWQKQNRYQKLDEGLHYYGQGHNAILHFSLHTWIQILESSERKECSAGYIKHRLACTIFKASGQHWARACNSSFYSKPMG